MVRGGRMKTPSKDPVRVSDHALIRYLERAMGLNIEVVREHIAGLCGGAAAFGASTVRAEGVRFAICDNTVTTVMPDGQQPTDTLRARIMESHP